MTRPDPYRIAGFALCLLSGGVLFGLLYGISALIMFTVR